MPVVQPPEELNSLPMKKETGLIDQSEFFLVSVFAIIVQRCGEHFYSRIKYDILTYTSAGELYNDTLENKQLRVLVKIQSFS